MSELVLVVGATGGVGQLTVAQLLEKGFAVRALTRNIEKTRQMFDGKVEAVMGDIRASETLPGVMPGVHYIICCTGTTAFPSARWEFDRASSLQGFQAWQEWSKIYLDTDYRQTQAKNSPQQVDAQGVSNLVAVAPQSLQRFVFVSSCGVEHKTQFPYSVLNSFGVLDAKQQGEEAVKRSRIPYTIIRPGRLIDGPYTSYDLNTLLKAKTQGKLGIVIGTGDRLSGQTSRIDVAAACAECLKNSDAENQVFEIINQGPRPETIDWKQLFSQLPHQ